MTQTRRVFLKSLGLAGIGISAVGDAFASLFPAFNKLRFAPLTLNGKVQSEGKGLGGVVVTDGFTVTRTDSKGNYSLQSNSSAAFVYITMPRGYEFTNDQGIARFYKKIEPVNGKFNADFNLTKLSTDDSKHAFVVWADTQIETPEDAQLLKSQSVPDTLALVKSYGSNMPFHGIGCGDLVWDKFELFADYKEAVGKTGIPFFQVIGNHDMDIDARADDGSMNTFRFHFGPTYYSFNRGDVHYVVLDDVFFLGTSKKYIGYIAENQFAWLEQDLAHVKAGSTVVVALHIPVNTGARRRNKLTEDPIGGVVANRKALYKLLKPFRAHIMSGHTHFNEKVLEGDIIEHVHGTVCGAWWTGPICYDGTPNGYGVYEVNGSEINWYHKAVGYERDFQFRVYPTGSVPEYPDMFCVNVWNWDSQWKVEWFEDGKSMGEMLQKTSFDPLSVMLHAGTEKPAKRSWVDPVLTDHMFFAKHAADAKTITVAVKDRFNNVYRKEITIADLRISQS
ncbi:calcineurin-like phosphoesterase C-terminal domain-containing protein [Chryseosolibacter indicus]|uniref:Calcineurin-like phosphoesterase C-terminal domain-containing protein n=1 Tax=Chryseosolibacter indicus TaxID=2782351 RepID=A0ABS5VV39_9BACT|nr:calcineurin-like phosphoesterase family protein [Chryseosolibacter indicus]MBT1704918.1 calcineurin-like phosphoesterase C-terminal domain-containing protein [Chryseosolibacter indicus]